MSKLLVVEHLWTAPQVVESRDNGLPTKIKAVVQQADSKNLNKRLYPRPILEREIQKFNENPNRRPGLVDHPIENFASVEDIGILWNRVWMEDGGYVWGEGTLVETRKGRDLQAAIKAGVEIGISSRGYATAKRTLVNGDEVFVIGEDYELETFDAVVDPGVAEARIRHSEGVVKTMTKLETTEENNEGTAEETAVESQLNLEAIEEREVAVEEAKNAIAVLNEEAPTDEPADVRVDEAELAETAVPVKDLLVEKEVEIAEQATLISELTSRVAELSSKVDEAVADAATLQTHAANLRALVLALVQVSHDALDREDFWTVYDFSGAAMNAGQLASDLETLATSAPSGEETVPMETVAKAFARLLSEFHSAKLAKAVLEKCKDARYGIIVANRVIDKVTKFDDIETLIGEEQEYLDRKISERRSIPSPRGNPTESLIPALDKEKEEHLRLFKSMESRTK